MAPMQIPPDWHTPELFAQRLGTKFGRQRAMAADGHLLLVLHEPPKTGKSERVGRLFWRDPQGHWKAKPGGEGIAPLKRHVAEFAERTEQLEEQWQSADDAQDYYAILRAVVPLHRTVRNLHSALQQAREMAPDDREILNLRDQSVEIERALELLHGDARNGLDFTVAYQAELQTQRTYDMSVAAYRLNLMAAAFLPLATLGAVFGMNMDHGLAWSTSPLFFWSVLGMGLASGLILAQVIAKKPVRPQPPTISDKHHRHPRGIK